jgi:hypothetical protein
MRVLTHDNDEPSPSSPEYFDTGEGLPMMVCHLLVELVSRITLCPSILKQLMNKLGASCPGGLSLNN